MLLPEFLLVLGIHHIYARQEYPFRIFSPLMYHILILFYLAQQTCASNFPLFLFCAIA